MRNGELECVHGVGHSGGIHGCDGCCGIIAEQARINEQNRIKAFLLANEWKIQDDCSEYECSGNAVIKAVQLIEKEENG